MGGLAAGGGAALAVVVLAILLARGGTGRVGIVLAACAGTALGVTVTVWALIVDLIGMVASVAQAFAGALG